MASEYRTSMPGPGILSVGLCVLCWLLFFHEAGESPPREMPLGIMAIAPVAVILHIVALVAIGFGPRWVEPVAGCGGAGSVLDRLWPGVHWLQGGLVLSV